MSIIAVAHDALLAAAIELIYRRVKDFIQETLPELADEYEKRLEEQLGKLKPGDRFLDEIEIALVDDDYWYPVLRFSDIKISQVPGLKIDLITGTLKVSKDLNFKDASRPVTVDGILAYAFQISLERPDYGLSIGGGRDDILNFSQYLVAIRWDAIPLNFEGYYAESQHGGFVISVDTDLPFPVPLASTGLGLCGVGLTYGERFAPKLSADDSVDAIEQMRRASAQDYVNWARKNPLEQWRPTDANVRIFGLTTDIGDMSTSGCIVRFDDCGLTYVTSGPVVVFGGEFIALRMLDLGSSIAAFDIPSKSVFLSNSVSLPLADLMKITGRTEYSASLKDPSKTWVAIGGYSMDGAAISLLDIFELKGGTRLVPQQGFAMRAGARIRAEGKMLGSEGGFSLSVDVMSAIGWNPIQFEGQFSVDGYAWIKLLDREIGVGVRSDLQLRLPKPLELKFQLTFSIKIWFARISKTVTIFNLDDSAVQKALAALAIAKGSPISFILLANGAAGVINDKAKNPRNEVPPDLSFDIPFQRIAGGVPNSVNSAAGDGSYREGGIDVSHAITALRIDRIDETTGKSEEILVRSAWLGLADGEFQRRSSRLAIPCANPLAWLQAYEYASPRSIELSQDSVFQTFGPGPNEDILPTGPGTVPTLTLGRLRIEAYPLALRNIPLAKPYERGLCASSISLAVARDSAPPAVSLPVRTFDLRFACAGPPALAGKEVSGLKPDKVRDLGNGYAEWSVIIRRDGALAKSPLQVVSADEWPFTLVAVGYEIDWSADFSGSDVTILQPGVYELTLEGVSKAARAGVSADETGWEGLKERFRVVAPGNLRPYLRYATNGDERIFAKPRPAWNPNPAGLGFGHYKNHLGACRARVGYLSRIFPSVFVSLDEGKTLIETRVVDCTDGAIAGSLLSKQWDAAYRGTSLPEQEFVYRLPATAGAYKFCVFAIRSIGGEPEKIDEWPYRISRYSQPDDHLTPAAPGLCRAYGPFGTRAMRPTARSVQTEDLAGLADAEIAPGWALPAWIQRAAGIHADSGLAFLRIAEWAGLFKAPPPPHHEKLLAPPQQSELCILCDSDARPAALLWRTPEPLDWRRVSMEVYLRGKPGWNQRFQVRLTPSPDGTSCLVMLLADGVAIRIPAGDLAVDLTFHYVVPELPTLLDADDIEFQERRLKLAFYQALGRPWPLSS